MPYRHRLLVAYLKRLAVDILKIDQSFVAGLGVVAPDARVVVLSGLDPSEVADGALAAGAAGYLRKGADPARFRADLHRILDAPRVVGPSAAAPFGAGA